MATEDSLSDALEWSVAGAMARQYADDTRAFMQSFAELLQDAFPAETVVRREGLFGGDKRPVREIEITIHDAANGATTRYILSSAGHGPLSALRTQIVRGIALKTQTIPVPEWIENIGAVITAHAAQSKATRDALKRLL